MPTRGGCSSWGCLMAAPSLPFTPRSCRARRTGEGRPLPYCTTWNREASRSRFWSGISTPASSARGHTGSGESSLGLWTSPSRGLSGLARLCSERYVRPHSVKTGSSRQNWFIPFRQSRFIPSRMAHPIKIGSFCQGWLLAKTGCNGLLLSHDMGSRTGHFGHHEDPARGNRDPPSYHASSSSSGHHSTVSCHIQF